MGTISEPTADASATDEPVMPPKNMQTITLTMPRPPRTDPITRLANATKRRATLPVDINSPAKMKKGMGMSAGT